VPAIPEVLGPCRLLRRLGRGASGFVYLAEMVEERPYAAAGDEVAVKILRPSLDFDPLAFDRFVREAQLGARVDHPDVARTYAIEAITLDGEIWRYLVMEHVAGTTLAELLRQNQVLSEALLRDIAGHVASGLHAIHEAGAVHRDLKPAHIVLAPDQRVKLLDLGVAHLLDAVTPITHVGDFVGSPHYAAPEQFTDAPVTPATDLYSLGAILYEAATGTKPFAGRDLLSTMRRHVEHVPERASQLNADVTPFFDEVIAALLEKDPRRRLARAQDLETVLRDGERSAWWSARERSGTSASSRSVLRRIRVRRLTRLVGRDTELDLLEELLRHARTGDGSTVLLRGEAGVGKTRVIETLVRQLRADGADLTILYGSNPPGEHGGRGALADALVEHFGRSRCVSELRRLLVETPTLVPSFAAALLGREAPRGSAPLTSHTMAALYGHLARALTRERPVLWIVDDLHFARADEKAHLLALARAARDLRLLLVVTARPGHDDDGIADFVHEGETRLVDLGRLSPRDVGELLREALDSDTIADRYIEPVARRSDGNPFFVLEILSELRDQSQQDSDTEPPADVPSSIRSLVVARLAGLDEDERSLLDVAAIEGFSFDPDLTARVLGRKRLGVLQSLARIERRTTLVRAAGDRYEFDHHLLLEVVAASTPELLRREYNAELARAYAARERIAIGEDGVSGEAAAFLADHYLKGGDPTAAAALIRPALRHLDRTHRLDELTSIAKLALEVIGETDIHLRHDITWILASGLRRLGRRDEQRDALDLAIRCASDLGDDHALLRARCEVAELLRETAEYPVARARFDDVLARAEANYDWPIALQAMRGLGATHRNQGHYAEARSILERAVALAREHGDRASLAETARVLAGALTSLALYDDARRLGDESLAICREIGDRRGEAAAIGVLGAIAVDTGAFEEALAGFRHEATIYAELADLLGEVLAWQSVAVACGYLGDLAETRRALTRLRSLAQVVGDRQQDTLAMANLGLQSVLEGKLDEAETLLRAALDASRAIGSPFIECSSLMSLGDAARGREDLEKARRLYQQALSLDLGAPQIVAECKLALGRNALERGDKERAIEHLGEADRLTRAHGVSDPLTPAYLALLGERAHDDLSVPPSCPIYVRAEAHAVLHLAGAHGDHLEQAKSLLSHMSRHLDENERAAFRRFYPTARLVYSASA